MSTLVARLDNAGDVLLCGPAVRAVARRGDVVFLCGPRGRAAAELLPGVAHVVEFHAAWVDFTPPELTRTDVLELVEQIERLGIDEAVVFTSFHQSPLPLALILRMAGVRRISAISPDYPGSLLDVRHRVDDETPEPERAVSLAIAAGFPPDPDDDGAPALDCALLPDTVGLTGGDPYVVLHPGAAVPARRMSAERSRQLARTLREAGFPVVVTGGPDERELTATVAGTHALDLGGTTDFATLAAVLRDAEVVVAPNTGPAHLAAAVGTPVVSLFAPVVPALRWAPYGVPVALLGDQDAPCRDSRARDCPVPGHPCLDRITDAEVVDAVRRLRMHSAQRKDLAR